MSLEKDYGVDEVRHRCGSSDSNGDVDDQTAQDENHDDINTSADCAERLAGWLEDSKEEEVAGDSADDDQAAQDENRDIDHDINTSADCAEDSKVEEVAGEDAGMSASLTMIAKATPPSTEDTAAAAAAAAVAVAAVPSSSKPPLVPVPGRSPSTEGHHLSREDGESDANGAETSKPLLFPVAGLSPSSEDSRRSTAALASDGINRTCATSGTVSPGDVPDIVIGRGAAIIAIGQDQHPQPGAYRIVPTESMQLSDDALRPPSLARQDRLQPTDEASHGEGEGEILVHARLVDEEQHSRRMINDSGDDGGTGQTAAEERSSVPSGNAGDGGGGSAAANSGDLVVHGVPESQFVRRFKIGRHTCAVNLAWVAAVVILVIGLTATIVGLVSNGHSDSSKDNGGNNAELPALTLERAMEVLAPISGLDALNDPNAPQRMALTWLVEEDDLYVPPDDEEWIVQRYVAAVLFLSVGGPNSYFNETFLTPVNECEWFGLECKDKKIYSVTMAYGGLNGTLPHEIQHFSNVYQIYLSFNLLHGPIPSSIGNLTSLEELSLFENQLTSTIPSEIGNLQSLSLLLLARNRLTGKIPDSLANLQNLVWFFLEDNDLTGNLDFVCDLAFAYTIADCESDDVQCSCCMICT